METLIGRGIGFRHSRPYHPQTCGKIERFHQSLKKWLSRQPPAATVAQLQAQLDIFRGYYNTVRLHRWAATPQQAYGARPKAVPTGAHIDVSHHRVRRDTIDPSGVFTLRHNSRLHHIGIGRRHAGINILILVHDLHIRVLNTNGELIREPTSTRARTTNHNPKRERCPETPVHDVPRHHTLHARGYEPTWSDLHVW